MAKDDRQNGPAALQEWRVDTLIAHAGLDPRAYHGFVNPPVVRASTVIFENVDALLNQHTLRYPYGLSNTPTIEALTTALTALDGAAGTVLVPSGLAAVTVAILAVGKAGTSILVPDNVYGPTRRFCDESLPALGINTVYYDPLIGAGITGQLQNVSAVLDRKSVV
jgi:cystathionine beta-lyase